MKEKSSSHELGDERYEVRYPLSVWEMLAFCGPTLAGLAGIYWERHHPKKPYEDSELHKFVQFVQEYRQYRQAMAQQQKKDGEQR